MSPSKGFITIVFPEAYGPMERARRFGRPLQAALKIGGVGEVVGGGTRMSADRSIMSACIEVEAYKPLDETTSYVCKQLTALGAPPGTILEIATKDGDKCVRPLLAN